MPSWASNPGTFATTTKPDESHHKTVFELFGDDTGELERKIDEKSKNSTTNL